MTNAKYITVPGHSQQLPTGHFLARGLHPALSSLLQVAAGQIHAWRPVDLNAHMTALAAGFVDVIWHYYRDGMRHRARDILAAISRAKGGRLPLVRKNISLGIQGMDAAFDLSRPEVVESIRRAAFDLAQSTLQTATMHATEAANAARNAVAEGVGAGDATRDLNRRLFQIFADPAKAARIAQTEASRGFHAGAMEAARASRVVRGLRWLASSDACDICRGLNGKEVGIGEAFAKIGKPGPYQMIYHPPAHPHCLTGETAIQVSGAVGAFKAFYRGPRVRIVLASGDSLTCTPNHMFLTVEGFAFASSLVKGDDIIACPDAERLILDGPNNYRKPTRIDQVVGSFSESRGVLRRVVPVAPEYLHGDAAFCEGNIDVVHANGLGRNEIDPRGGQFVSEPDFQGAAVGLGSLIGRSTLDALFDRVLSATGRFVGRSRESLAVLFAHRRVSLGKDASHRFRDAANADCSLPEASVNDLSRHAENLRQLVVASSGLITTNKIVDIQFDPGGHVIPVYDIQTQSSLYIVSGGLVSSNCFCTTTSVISSADIDDRAMAVLQTMAFGPASTSTGVDIGLTFGRRT
jgi:hypothetical protein